MTHAAWRVGGLTAALLLGACLPMQAPMGAPDAPSSVKPRPTTAPTAIASPAPAASASPTASPSAAPTASGAPASPAPSVRPSPFPHFYARTDAPVPASPEPGSIACGDRWQVYERFSDDPLAVYVLTFKGHEDAGKLVGRWNADRTELTVQPADPTTDAPIAGQPTYVLRPQSSLDHVHDFIVESGGRTFYLTDFRGGKVPCQ